jgi:hypothetical protein
MNFIKGKVEGKNEAKPIAKVKGQNPGTAEFS